MKFAYLMFLALRMGQAFATWHRTFPKLVFEQEDISFGRRNWIVKSSNRVNKFFRIQTLAQIFHLNEKGTENFE